MKLDYINKLYLEQRPARIVNGSVKTYGPHILLIKENAKGWDPNIKSTDGAGLPDKLDTYGADKIEVIAITVPERYAAPNEIDEQLVKYSEVFDGLSGYTFTGFAPLKIDGHKIDGKYVAGLIKK